MILSVNGREVDQSSTLPRLIGQVSPGNEVELTLLRDGERREETVTLGEWPDARGETAASASEEAPSRLGIAVQPLDEDERETLGIAHGVRVVEVDPSGVAAAAGLRAGDVLVSIDHRPVEAPDQLADLVAELPEDRAVPVRLFRDGRSMFVAMRLASD